MIKLLILVVACACVGALRFGAESTSAAGNGAPSCSHGSHCVDLVSRAGATVDLVFAALPAR